MQELNLFHWGNLKEKNNLINNTGVFGAKTSTKSTSTF